MQRVLIYHFSCYKAVWKRSSTFRYHHCFSVISFARYQKDQLQTAEKIEIKYPWVLYATENYRRSVVAFVAKMLVQSVSDTERFQTLVDRGLNSWVSVSMVRLIVNRETKEQIIHIWQKWENRMANRLALGSSGKRVYGGKSLKCRASYLNQAPAQRLISSVNQLAPFRFFVHGKYKHQTLSLYKPWS